MIRTRDAFYADAETKTHITIDYTQELYEDEVLKGIKKFCLSYLDDRSVIQDITSAELLEMRTFLNNSYSEAMQMKEALQLKNYSWPFMSIAKGVDSITMAQNLNDLTTEETKFVLTKDINSLLESLAFCYGILEMVIQDFYAEN